MDLNFLMEYVNLIVMGICLCVGFALKHAKIFDKLGNQYIPLCMLVLGTVINVLINLHGINAEVILTGMMSGLASTGLYELFKNLIGLKNTSETN